MKKFLFFIFTFLIISNVAYATENAEDNNLELVDGNLTNANIENFMNELSDFNGNEDDLLKIIDENFENDPVGKQAVMGILNGLNENSEEANGYDLALENDDGNDFNSASTSNTEILHLKGTVKEVGEVYTENTGGMEFKWQDVKVHIKDGGFNTTKLMKYSISFYTDVKATNPPLKVGDKVYVYTTVQDGKIIKTDIEFRNNIGYLIAVVAIYGAAILIIGGVKGLKAIISLVLTVLAVFCIILPTIRSGLPDGIVSFLTAIKVSPEIIASMGSPVFVTIVTSIGIILVAIAIIEGFNKKALAAMLGTAAGIVIAGVFATVFGKLMAISGLCEHSLMLMGTLEDSAAIDFKGIFLSGIIIGALGACMDVSVSISSALNELKEENPHITVRRMIKAGMNIGKDMMGTMTNTLILAYAGSSMALILIYMGSGMDFLTIINGEMMIEEVLRSIAGSFGLVLTIPFTTVVASLLMGRREERGKNGGDK